MTGGPDISGAQATRYQRLGRYELLGEIASGGMATVYLGRALGAKGFARLVAIKKLHPHLQNEEEFVSMFLDEARLAARIRHPNVVPTLDVDDRDGLYIVMEYIEGDRLLGLLRFAARGGSRIPPSVALKIAIESLSGLHAAHELEDDEGRPLNLVHRDVSPQNVLIGIDGITKITDFGIAKAESRLSQTRDGQLKGKIAYMAPEQTRRGDIDRRVDVFAMGILAWEMLSGRRLFRGDNDVEVLNAVVNEPIPTLSSVAPELPTELTDVVMKALDREPDARWSTAMDFADALEQIAPSVGGLASTRAVAQYVQQVAGPKLEQERAKLRAGMLLRGRTEEPSSPHLDRNGVPRSELPTPGQTPTPHSLDVTPLPVPAKGRRPLIAALLLVGGTAAAAALWYATRPPAPTVVAARHDPTTGSPTTNALPSPPAPTPTLATNTAPAVTPDAGVANSAHVGSAGTHSITSTGTPSGGGGRHPRGNGAHGSTTPRGTTGTPPVDHPQTPPHDGPSPIETIGVNPYNN